MAEEKSKDVAFWENEKNLSNKENADEKIKTEKWRQIILQAIKEEGLGQTIASEKKIKQKKEEALTSKSKDKNEEGLAQTFAAKSEKEKLIKSIKQTNKKISTKSTTKKTPAPPEFVKIQKKNFLGKILKLTFNLFIVLICLTVFIVIFFGVGLYRYQWNDKYTNQIIKLIPYPVAMVNGQMLSWSEFRDNVSALSQYYKKQEQISLGVKIALPLEKIQEDVLRRMITTELIRQLAKKYHLNINQEEINNYFIKISREAGSEKEVKNIIRELYGWDEKIYKERVLSVSLLVEKLDKFLDLENKELNEVLKKFQDQSEIRRFFY